MLPPCASTAPASGPAASATAMRMTSMRRRFMGPSGLVGKRPQTKLLLGDLPEPRESVRLHDQEEYEYPAEHHELDLLLQRHRHGEAQRVGRIREEDRYHHDEGGAEERAQDAPQPADDHHEQHEEREVDVEGERLRAAEVEEHVLRARHPAVERRD